MKFETLRKANRLRLPQFKNRKGEYVHTKADGSDWALSAWSNAVAGEAGELCNLIKKIERGDHTLEEVREEVAYEIADVITYLDILALRCGIDMGDATRVKFNIVSERVGVNVRIVDDAVTHSPTQLCASDFDVFSKS